MDWATPPLLTQEVCGSFHNVLVREGFEKWDLISESVELQEYVISLTELCLPNLFKGKSSEISSPKPFIKHNCSFNGIL